MKVSFENGFWTAILMITTAVYSLRGADDWDTKMKEIPEILTHLTQTLKTYDKRLRPNAGGKPVEIRAEFKVGSIGEINEAEMSYSLDIFFRHWWIDTRLKSNFSQPITLSLDASSIIWIPDTYFLNSKKSEYHQVIGDCMRLILWPNGSIYYSVRLSLLLRCEMDLHLYPFDTQHCPFIVESHAYTEDDVVYNWNRNRTHGIEVASNQTAQFFLLEAKLENTLVKKIAGTYSTLFATFSFKRRLEFFIMTVFAPATILTLMSWCSLWISSKAVPARISLCITTILSIILLTSNANSHMPKVSYMKAMDAYLLGCLSFIFMTLVEFVVVLNVSSDKPTKSEVNQNTSASTEEKEDINNEPRTNKKNNERKPRKHGLNFQDFSNLGCVSGIDETGDCDVRMQVTNQRKEDQSIHYIDRASRVLFPLMFILFIGLFSVWYFV